MKRHAVLEPFSRDHNDGLILARALQLGREGAEDAIRRAWDDELKDHFDEEERLLGPLAVPAMLDQMIDEHRQIETMIQNLPVDAVRLGNALHDHIRWEERVLFPAIEATVTDTQLAVLAEGTTALEVRRWKAETRREELVTRRMK